MDEQMLERYRNILEKISEVDGSRVRLDLQALIKFAKDKGLRSSQLTEEEILSFIRKA